MNAESSSSSSSSVPSTVPLILGLPLFVGVGDELVDDCEDVGVVVSDGVVDELESVVVDESDEVDVAEDSWEDDDDVGVSEEEEDCCCVDDGASVVELGEGVSLTGVGTGAVTWA
jgi:hypothetical protein